MAHVGFHNRENKSHTLIKEKSLTSWESWRLYNSVFLPRKRRKRIHLEEKKKHMASLCFLNKNLGWWVVGVLLRNNHRLQPLCSAAWT